MARTLKEAIKHRRTYYSIKGESPVSDREIQEIIFWAVKHVPSAYNSQSARVVLLLKENHAVLWDIVKEALREKVLPENFPKTAAKIDNSFKAGYGTVLFFEDTTVVKGMQEAYPSYEEKFPEWSLESSGMLQFAVWTMLEDVGFGASLQHYNPLIDRQVQIQWDLPESWELMAQMPFGTPAGEPGPKEFNSLEKRVLVAK